MNYDWGIANGPNLWTGNLEKTKQQQKLNFFVLQDKMLKIFCEKYYLTILPFAHDL